MLQVCIYGNHTNTDAQLLFLWHYKACTTTISFRENIGNQKSPLYLKFNLASLNQHCLNAALHLELDIYTHICNLTNLLEI